MRDRAEHLRRKDEEEGTTAVAERAPADGPVARIQDMQRGMGNAAVVELLGAQAKLTVGAVHDPAEAEADRVAAAVLRNLDAGPVGAEKEGAARMVRRKGAPSAAAAAPGHGLEGGEALPETSAAIDAARGGGQQMDPGTLSRMEGAFGADLSDVRIHADGHAASLSRDLNAKAFTTGKDVFFGAGEYDPKSRAGTEVLAHELTHTIQQSGGVQGGGEASRKVRRLAVDGTKWEKTKTAKVSESGSFGAGIFDDGSGKVVVKPGESQAVELLMAANLVNEMGGAMPKGKKDWALSTPGCRIATPAEAKRIRDVFWSKNQDQKDNERYQAWAGRLDTPSTVVFDFAKGDDYADIVNENKQLKKQKKGKEDQGPELDPKSIIGNLMSDPGQLKALGVACAADVYMGNADRLAELFNPENFKADMKKKSISLIDNSQKVSHNVFVANDDFPDAKEGFDYWLTKGWVNQFVSGDYQSMAAHFVDELAYTFTFVSGTGDKKFSLPEERKTLSRMTEDARPQLEQWFVAGLAEGKQRLMIALNDPVKLIGGLPEDKMGPALAAAYARKYVMNGVPGDKAWEMGRKAAEARMAQLFPKKEDPQVQDNPLYEDAWTTNPLYQDA